MGMFVHVRVSPAVIQRMNNHQSVERLEYLKSQPGGMRMMKKSGLPVAKKRYLHLIYYCD